MKKILLLLVLSACSISCSKSGGADIYCLQCMDESGNAIGDREHNTPEWAKANSGPGKRCHSYAYNPDKSCP